MRGKFKYNDGDQIGPYHITMIKRTKKDNNNSWHGIFKCPFDGKEFEASIGSISSGGTKSCGCLKRKRDLEKIKMVNEQKLNVNNKKDLTGQKFGNWIVLYENGSYKNGSVLWHCVCNCSLKTEKDIDGYSLTSGRTTSCGCRKESRGEEKVKMCLQSLNIYFEVQKTFNNCRNPKTGYLLKFDFYLPNYNCCIEYDGKQHFCYDNNINSWNTKQHLIDTQYRDEFKNQYCKDNGIAMIRIPYTDFEKINEKYILERIGEINE